MTARALLLLLLLLFCPATIPALPRPAPQPAYDLFYLAVGSSYYAQDASPRGFKNVAGANKSAKRVSAFFDQAGAVAGITLTSESDRLVTRNDVLKALGDLLAKVKRSGSKNPLVIFYFCGHGVSEGVGWNHFSIPGDFNVSAERIDIQTLTDSALYAGEVSDAIEKEKFTGLLLLDACYEGKQVELLDAVISRRLAENLTDIFKVLRHMNEFRDGPTLAVFSIKPGDLASTVQDPLDPDSQLSVGPLARRVMLSFDRAFRGKSTLTVAQFLGQMANAAFDPETRSVMTLSVPEYPTVQLIKYPLSERSACELRLGSGGRGEVPTRRK
jgi:hypothetical protein